MSIVSNTGPLVALAKVDALHLLSVLFGNVFIPPSVHRELLAKTGPEAGRLDEGFGEFIQIAQAPSLPPDLEQKTRALDAGEKQAIALAVNMTAVLLMDERAGRSVARRLGLKVIGTVAVLLQAKEEGLIPLVCPVLHAMRRNGYWLSDALLRVAANLAGEGVAPAP